MYGVAEFGRDYFGTTPEIDPAAGTAFGTGDAAAVGQNASRSARVSTFALEVVSDNQDAKARVSSFALEVVSDNQDAKARVSSFALEIVHDLYNVTVGSAAGARRSISHR
jgi:heme-binding NEAT domain protein